MRVISPVLGSYLRLMQNGGGVFGGEHFFFFFLLFFNVGLSRPYNCERCLKEVFGLNFPARLGQREVCACQSLKIFF